MRFTDLFLQVGGKGNFRMGLVFTPFTKDNATLLKSRNVTQQGGDVYNNSFFYRSGGLTSQAPNCYPVQQEGTRTAKRKIAGLVWLDQDQNGNYRPAINGYSTTDRLLSKVDVYLYQESEPSSSKITKNPDGSFSQVDWRQNTDHERHHCGWQDLISGCGCDGQPSG